jgi:hypothetical protein
VALRHPLLGVLVLLVAGPAALAGESQRLGLGGNWPRAQEAAAAAEIVVAATVIKADVPTGKGWNGQYGSPSQQSTARRCTVDVQQLVEVEVDEVIRGRVRGRRFVTKLEAMSVEYHVVRPFWAGLVQAKKVDRRKPGLPPSYFALEEGRAYLFFLKRVSDGRTVNEEGEEEQGPDKLALHGGWPPMLLEGRGLLKSVRRFCRELEAWNRPAALGAEEDRAVRELIAALGADDYERREKAESALRAMGAGVRTYLEKACAAADEERSFRARRLLRGAKPEPGKVEFPGHEVDRRSPAIFKERPKPKPPEEDAPEPDPEAEPVPDPGEAGGGDPGGGE